MYYIQGHATFLTAVTVGGIRGPDIRTGEFKTFSNSSSSKFNICSSSFLLIFFVGYFFHVCFSILMTKKISKSPKLTVFDILGVARVILQAVLFIFT